MAKIELVKNADGFVTQIIQDGTTYTLSYPEKEEYLALTKLKQWIKMSDGSYVAFKKAGGTAQTTPQIPENATFAEVLQQAEDNKELFIGNYARDKIDAKLLENMGTSTSRGTFYNSGTDWRNLFNMVNAYIDPDLEEGLFNYLIEHLGTYVVLKFVFGDNRTGSTVNRLSPVHEITELDKEYTFEFELDNQNWNYDMTIEIRSSDRKIKFNINHGLKSSDRDKFGPNYGAIRGLWFEEL